MDEVALAVAIVALIVSFAALRAARRPRDPMEMLQRYQQPAPARVSVRSEPDPFRRPGEGGSVVLVEAGSRKIHVIKVIRTATGIGLKEAKDLVETPTPVTIAEGLSSEQARVLLADLEAAGATAELS